MTVQKVLIISDNAYLCKALFDLIHSQNNLNATFDLAISMESDAQSFSPLYVKKINLKSEKQITGIIEAYSLVISMHCKQIFPPQMVEGVRCINVHPGYNPINRGWYPQVFALFNGLPVGATIHEIDNELDHGKIIARTFVEKNSYDTSLSLYNKVIEAEFELIKIHLKQIIDGTYKAIEPESEGNLFLKKDFNQLCEINLDEFTTYRDCINRFRALSHGEHLNAYFRDEKSGEKIYLKLDIIRKNA
jgi:methionyl-tRNA formyltransferase